jgi:hypothetical protein
LKKVVFYLPLFGVLVVCGAKLENGYGNL